jgi:DNA helicase II / ATP-dependent DNA helicase PcrA
MLLMTFSRRAAAEMTQRVERIARRFLGNKASIMTDALTWAGTFHGMGAASCANMLSASASTPLSPFMTVRTLRSVDLVRHGLEFSKTESRFPTKGTCLAIYSRCVNAEKSIEAVLGQHYP